MLSSFSRGVSDYKKYVNPYWVAALDDFLEVRNFVSGEGSRLYDEHGNEWLDLVAGYGSALLGHNSEVICGKTVLALNKQLVSLQPWGVNLETAKLAKKLVQSSPLASSGAKVVFGSSGSEAVEAAIKMAICHTGRHACVGFNQGFHGLTISAMSVAGPSIWNSVLLSKNSKVYESALIEPLLKEQPETWLNRLREGRYAAVVIELVQGIGGGFRWTEEALERLVHACDETGTLIIVDEVQTGIGRCGEVFYSSSFADFIPDMIVVSKGLSGGIIPTSAVIVSDLVHHSMFSGDGRAKIHGSTFSGSAIGANVALAVLEQIETKGFLARVKRNSSWLKLNLEKLNQNYKALESVDGDGFLICVKFADQDQTLAAYFVQLFAENQILVNLASHRVNTMKITPAINITRDELQRFLDVFEALLQYLENEDEVA